MKTATTKSNPFREQLAKNIDETIRKEKRAGTCGMGLDNLRMIVPSPAYFMDGSPKGTNCYYHYAEMFREVVKESRSRSSFVIQW